jgi:gliding motility-associatede transport system auxiliary component
MTSNSPYRKLFLGGGTAAGVLIFLAIIVAIQYIALEHPKRWDLTRAGKHTLSPQSKKVLDTFKEKKLPIDVLAFYEVKDTNARGAVRDLLDQYRDVYGSFTYSFIDPDQNRTLALQNKIDSYPSIVLKAGKKDERISTANEETVTNALTKLLRTEDKKIYLVKGHGELSPSSKDPEGFSTAKEQIEKQNYKVKEIVLMQTASIPDDATMLLIAGPKTDPLDSELELIKNYIKRGGSVFVLLNPFKTPKLAAFLKDYGFETADGIVVDRMSRVFGGDYLMPVITTYINFPITKNFSVASFFPEVRSVRAADKPKPNVTVQDLALTSPVSWTISEAQLKSGNANFDEKTGQKGPISVMAVSTYNNVSSPDKKSGKGEKTAEKSTEPTAQAGGNKGTENPAKKVKARIVVAGSSLFADNKYFKLQGNGDLFMNSVSWLAEDENLIAIRPKSSKSQPIVLTGNQPLIILLVPVVLVPLGWIIAGVVVYLYRRRTVVA